MGDRDMGRHRFLTIAAFVAAIGLAVTLSACGEKNTDETSEETAAAESVPFESGAQGELPGATETAEVLPEYMTMPITVPAEAYTAISLYAQANGVDVESYPQEALDLLAVFPDAREFAFEYPQGTAADEQVRNSTQVDMTESYSPARMSEIYQWDTRWGYKDYCTRYLGLMGSGPTCVSICSMYLLENDGFNPAWIADYAINNHYCDNEGGSGTYRTLITDGGYGLGIDVVQITNEEQRVKNNIDVGNPIICAMDGGIFGNPYETEHYIIITGYDDEGFTIIDPGSRTRTGMRWQWSQLSAEIQALWVYRIL